MQYQIAKYIVLHSTHNYLLYFLLQLSKDQE